MQAKIFFFFLNWSITKLWANWKKVCLDRGLIIQVLSFDWEGDDVGRCRGESTWEKLPTDQLQIKGTLCSLQKAGCVGEGSVTVYIFQEWLADLLVEYDLQGDPLSLLYQQDLSAVIMLVLVWKEVDQNVENTLVPGVLSYFFPTFYSYVYPIFSTENARTIYSQFFKCVTFAIYIWCKLFVL